MQVSMILVTSNHNIRLLCFLTLIVQSLATEIEQSPSVFLNICSILIAVVAKIAKAKDPLNPLESI